jgi:hypothetical protein
MPIVLLLGRVIERHRLPCSEIARFATASDDVRQQGGGKGASVVLRTLYSIRLLMFGVCDRVALKNTRETSFETGALWQTRLKGTKSARNAFTLSSRGLGLAEAAVHARVRHPCLLSKFVVPRRRGCVCPYSAEILSNAQHEDYSPSVPARSSHGKAFVRPSSLSAWDSLHHHATARCPTPSPDIEGFHTKCAGPRQQVRNLLTRKADQQRCDGGVDAGATLHRCGSTKDAA